MRRIAREQTRHAALAWEIASWAARRLGPEARARIAEAQSAALAELLAALAELLAAPLVPRSLGPPSPAEARSLLTGLGAELGLAA